MSKLNLKEILLSLMSIRSYSGEEKELSNYVYKFLQERGFSPIKIGENIICSLNNSIDNFNQKKIALVGHLDTIILAEEPVIRQDENIILGLGSVDMKAGLSCMLKLTEELDKIKHNIILVFYTGEESPLPNGLTELIDKRIFEALDLAIILEPTNSEIEVGCFGRILAEYCFYGKQAHSAYSDEGTNAIYRARGFIEKLSQIQLPEKDNNSFKESINITKIETDSPTNQIPDICRIYVDYRFSPNLDEKQAKENLIQFVGQPFDFIDISLGALMKENTILNKEGKQISRFWTDSAQLNNNGIPAINFGPGNPKLAHSDKEHINLVDLEEFYKKLVDFLN